MPSGCLKIPTKFYRETHKTAGMFIFFYMNIPIFFRDAIASVRDVFKYNKIKVLLYVGIFLSGMLLGFIFYKRIEETEWLFKNTINIVLVTVQSKNFFAVWFQNFWLCAKVVLILFCLNLFRFGKYFHFILVLVRGAVLSVASVVLIKEFGFMGGVYLFVFFVVRSGFLFVCIFLGKYISLFDGGCLNRDWWKTAKKYLFLLVACLVVCFALSLVVFLILRPLFAIG